MAMKRHGLRTILIAAKLGITGAFLYWLLAQTDMDAVERGIRSLDFLTLVFAVGIHMAAFSLMGVRWWLLLRHADPHVPLSRVFPSYYLGVFLNLVLPTGVGGDVARTAHLGWHGLGLRALISSMIMDRVVGLTTVMLMGSVSVLLMSGVHLDPEVKRYSALLGVIVLVVITLFFSVYPGRLMHRVRGRVMPALIRIAQSCYAYRSNPHLLAATAGLSLVSQSLIILVYYLLSEALGLGIPVSNYFAIVPIVFISALLPSLGGLGVRESVLVGLLLALAVDGQAAITLSLMYLAVLWIASLPGLVVVFQKVSGPAEQAPDA